MPRKDGVHAPEVVAHGPEDGVLGDMEAVGAGPLEEADPDGGLREVVGVGIEFDAVQLPRADHGQITAEAEVHGVDDDFLFEVLEFLEGDVEEVAGTAGGVEDAKALQADEEGVENGIGLAAGFPERRPGGGLGLRGVPFFPSRGEETPDGGADFGPFATEGGQDDGFDEGFDILAARVVGAELRALGGIEAAFEERAEDGGIHRAPVQPGGLEDGGHFRHGHGQHFGAFKQVAVEMPDGFETEVAAVGHGLEQLAEKLAKAFGVAAGFLDDPREDHIRQETDILREEAEDEPVEEMRDRGRILSPPAHGLGDAGEAFGGVLGDGLAGAAGFEFLGVEEDRAEDLEVAGFAHGFEGNLEGGGYGAGEIGVDDDAVEITHGEQRRIRKGVAVPQELVIGGVEVLVPAFVFPAEMIALPDIGEAIAAAVLGGALFKAEGLARGIGGGGRGVIEKGAEIEEMLLGGGPFLQFHPPPLRNELGHIHVRREPSTGASQNGHRKHTNPKKRGALLVVCGVCWVV